MTYTFKQNDTINLTKHAQIALATAAIEKSLPLIEKRKEIFNAIHSMVDYLWNWQTQIKISGKSQMSVEESKAFPSYYLYDKYTKSYCLFWQMKK